MICDKVIKNGKAVQCFTAILKPLCNVTFALDFIPSPKMYEVFRQRSTDMRLVEINFFNCHKVKKLMKNRATNHDRKNYLIQYFHRGERLVKTLENHYSYVLRTFCWVWHFIGAQSTLFCVSHIQWFNSYFQIFKWSIFAFWMHWPLYGRLFSRSAQIKHTLYWFIQLINSFSLVSQI